MLKWFFVLLCFLLFISKSYVFYLGKIKNNLIQESKKVKDDLSSLKVEWRYLNNPKRIQKLSERISKELS
ncbi:hypothetical protein [Alphaproteobacteria bacterium endosymbiont of Tiliacea citrago]|uniref:hypothetical protein n=1 Tax=Alphaproteobacteria bacterium endosymbiont of Tiliacea citrago TaxID=3077944 RepID=UPI00313EB724